MVEDECSQPGTTSAVNMFLKFFTTTDYHYPRLLSRNAACGVKRRNPGRMDRTQERYPSTVELYPGIILKNMVLEPRTKHNIGTKNQEWYRNQEPKWFQNQEPRTVPEPRAKNGALCLRVYIYIGN